MTYDSYIYYDCDMTFFLGKHNNLFPLCSLCYNQAEEVLIKQQLEVVEALQRVLPVVL
jgi:hypothetical protein